MKNKNIFNYIYGIAFISILGFFVYAEVPSLFILLYCLFGLSSLIFLTYNQLRLNDMKHENLLLTSRVAKQRVKSSQVETPIYGKDDGIDMGKGFKIYQAKNMKKLSDIAGYDEVKTELTEIIDFLKNPKKYQDMGAQIPHGVLFMGPPGTGKTMFAKAVAGEANVKFIYTSGSEFMEKFVGVGASRMREMFDEAKKTHEPCIIFIDEIDAIGGARSLSGNDSEKDKTLNQLLVEMDGFEETSHIVVIAATNRKDMLDSALLRPGRFDRHILIDLPTREERFQILKVQAKNKKISLDLDFMDIARKTPSFSGAQLAAVLNESALLAVRGNQPLITNDLIDESIDRVLMGPSKKNKSYIEKEKRIVAYHEAGHAVVGMTLEDSMQVEKITIIPRGDSGGYNLFSEKEETFFSTKKSILAQITGLLAGRASEELMFNDVTNGASSDLRKATSLARKYICQYGMSSLGLIQMDNEKIISEKTAEKVDVEMNHILDDCYQQSLSILKTHKNLLNAIANELLENETIDSTQISQLAVQYI